MGVGYCPRCQGGVAFAAGQAYCPRCGWNRHVAALQIRSLQRLLPVFLLPLVAFGFLLVAHQERWQPFLYVLLVGVAFYVWARRSLGRALERLERLERLQPIDPDRLKLSALPDPSEEEDARARELARLPRPRPVELTSSGRYFVAAVLLAGAIFELILLLNLVPLLAGAGWSAVVTAEGWFLIAGALFFPSVMALVVYGLLRQKQLLVHGESALAKVIRQWKVGGNSWICYEFSAGGATLRKNAIDASHRLYTGMIVPIFYDAAKVTRQVACCAARYQIVPPGSR